MVKYFSICAVALFLLVIETGCTKEDTLQKSTIAFNYQFDKQQQRLNNIGQPANIPVDNAAQTPDFHSMSVHYIELAPSAYTQLGKGQIVYKGVETSKGGDSAVDFDQAPNLAAGEEFAEIDLSTLAPGSYEWVRVSVTYQNYDVKFSLKNSAVTLSDQDATIASFVGFNTYISSVSPLQKTLAVNANKKQGFWAIETRLADPYAAYNTLTSGQAPAGGTTVVNPLFATSPVPQGSCVVTGKFAQPLVITGTETGKLKVNLSFSIKDSFEWKDLNGNGKWDLSPTAAENEAVVDMGLRGLIPSWEWK